MAVTLWQDRRILDLLDIEHPIILAPMASASNAELVAAVSEVGGLGSFGAAGTPPDRLRATVQAIQQRTGRPFNINLFSPHTEEFDRAARPGPQLADRLEAYHSELGIGRVPYPAQYAVSRDLRKAAAARGDADFIAMWAGQGVGLIKQLPAEDLVNELVVESQKLLSRLGQG